MKNQRDWIIDQLIDATQKAKRRFVGVELMESQDQESGNPVLMTNIGFPSASIRQNSKNALENPKKKAAGRLALRLKSVVVRYEIFGAKFDRNIMSQEHFDVKRKLIIDEQNRKNTTAKSSNNKRGFSAKLNVPAFIKGMLGIGTRGPDRPVDTNASITNNIEYSGEMIDSVTSSEHSEFLAFTGRFAKYGGHQVDISGDYSNSRFFDIEVSDTIENPGLKGSIFPDKFQIRTLSVPDASPNVSVTASWELRSGALEIHEATGLFDFMKPKSKGRTKLYERALGELVAELTDSENTVARLDFEEI